MHPLDPPPFTPRRAARGGGRLPIGVLVGLLVGLLMALVPATAAALSLRITVTSAESGQPIAGARVFLRWGDGEHQVESRTNLRGVAVIEDLPAVKLKIQITATADWEARGEQIDLATLGATPEWRVTLKAKPPEPLRQP